MNDLNILIEKDNLKKIELMSKHGFIHREHRFVLPLVLYAQRKGFLPKPCNLIGFDNHHDCSVPKKLDDIIKLNLDNINISYFVKFCETELSILDDDWIITGIELGLFNDVIMFGVTENLGYPNHIQNNQYIDHDGRQHKIYIKSSHPGPMLSFQGDLSDVAKGYLKEFWSILGWEMVQKKGFRLRGNINPFLIDIDLDCYSIYWSDFNFPWLDEVYEERYFKKSDYHTTEGLSGKRVFQSLINKAGFVTIATEPKSCGGEKNSDKILSDVNRLLFDNGLKIY